jgi:hypothetical protein
MLKKVPRNDRLVNISPCSDVDLRHGVGLASVTTADTPEQISLRPVSLLIDAADGADVTRPPRRDGHDFYSRELGLVFHETSELMESPGVEAATLRPTGRNLASDSLEVFKGDPSLGAFGFGHQPLGDDMVHVPP